MSTLTDSVIIILKTNDGVITDASILTDPTGTYPQGIQAERVVLRGDSDRNAVLDLLLQNSGYVVPTYDDYQRKQLENIELLLRDIKTLLIDANGLDGETSVTSG